MNTEDIKELEFGFDGTVREAGHRQVVEEAVGPGSDKSRAERPKGGLSAIFLLGFFVIGLALVWMHYDSRRQLRLISATGSARMSEQFNEQISTLSKQISDQKSVFEKQLSNLNAHLVRTDAAVIMVKKDQSAASQLQAAVDAVKKTMASVQENLAALDRKGGTMTAETARVSKQLATLEEDILNTRLGLEQEMELVKSRGVDQTALAASLKKDRALQQENLAKMSEVLLNSIRSLEKDVAELKRRLVPDPAGTGTRK